MLSCEQFLASLSEYLDGDLTPALAEEARLHSLECSGCHALLVSSRQMLGWAADDNTFAMPPEVRHRLHARLRQRLEAPETSGESASEAAPPDRPAAGEGNRPVFHGPLGPWGRFLSFRPAWAAAIVLLLLIAGVVHWRAAASTTSGWLMDRHCFAALHGHFAEHPRDCLLRCFANGYGVVDANGHFLPFDAQGNRSARAALKASHKTNHIWVTVHARHASGRLLQVDQLALTAPPDAPSGAE